MEDLNTYQIVGYSLECLSIGLIMSYLIARGFNKPLMLITILFKNGGEVSITMPIIMKGFPAFTPSNSQLEELAKMLDKVLSPGRKDVSVQRTGGTFERVVIPDTNDIVAVNYTMI